MKKAKKVKVSSGWIKESHPETIAWEDYMFMVNFAYGLSTHVNRRLYEIEYRLTSIDGKKRCTHQWDEATRRCGKCWVKA